MVLGQHLKDTMQVLDQSLTREYCARQPNRGPGMRTRLVLSIGAGVLSLAVASPAVAAEPTIVDETVTVTREDALAAYAANPDEIFLDCGDFVVLAAFTAEDRVITFEDRQLRLVSFTGELFRPDTGVTV